MEAITISRSKLILTTLQDEVVKARISEASMSNLISTKEYNGFISKATTKRVKSMVEGFITSIESVQNKHKKVAIREKIQPTFATLTLPYKQFHKDNIIKRKCLTPFIEELKKFHNVKLYVWRAEPQDNGNIHFHILLDRFVDWKDIRSRWNRIINKLEYVDAFEQKWGHNNPNSTDIHGLEKVGSISSYIVKYMTKNKVRRKIEGRVWGASKEFHNFKNLRIPFTYDLLEDLEMLVESGTIFPKLYDYCRIFSIRMNNLTDLIGSKIAAIYEHYINSIFTTKLLYYDT